MEVATVVVGGWLLDLQHDALAARVDPPAFEPELGDDRVPIEIGVVDEEAPIVGHCRMEGETEQAALAAAADPIADVEGDLSRRSLPPGRRMMRPACSTTYMSPVPSSGMATATGSSSPSTIGSSVTGGEGGSGGSVAAGSGVAAPTAVAVGPAGGGSITATVGAGEPGVATHPADQRRPRNRAMRPRGRRDRS